MRRGKEGGQDADADENEDANAQAAKLQMDRSLVCEFVATLYALIQPAATTAE